MTISSISVELNKIFHDKKFLIQIAEKIIDIIVKRTKSGKGVSDDKVEDPALIKLASLSSGYIEYRKKVKLGSFGSPSKSNLTLTGQMLDSLIYKIVNNGILIDVANTKRKKAIGSGYVKQTNQEVAGYVSENGRPFLALSPGEQRIIIKFIDDYLTKELRRTLK